MRWLDKLVLEVVSESLPVPSSPTVVAGDVATDLATMFQIALGKSSLLRVISGNVKAAYINGCWAVAYSPPDASPQQIFGVDANSLPGEPARFKVTISPSPLTYPVKGFEGYYGPSHLLTAYAMRLENHVQQEHR